MVVIMDPLSIGAAIAGLLTSAIKTSRLLKSLTASPDPPESMQTALIHLTSLSGTLVQLETMLKAMREDIYAVPKKTQREIRLAHIVVPLTSCVFAFSKLEKIIDDVRRDVYLPLLATNFADGNPLQGFYALDCMGDEVAYEDVLWAIENGDEYLAPHENVHAWNFECPKEAEGRLQTSVQPPAFDAALWLEREGEIQILLDKMWIQRRYLEAFVASLQRYVHLLGNDRAITNNAQHFQAPPR